MRARELYDAKPRGGSHRLRESVAAGLAVGMTEREAQEAVILAVLSRVTLVPQPRVPEAVPGAFVVAAEYGLQMVRLLRRQAVRPRGG